MEPTSLKMELFHVTIPYAVVAVVIQKRITIAIFNKK
jgi:hypothetical protein